MMPIRVSWQASPVYAGNVQMSTCICTTRRHAFRVIPYDIDVRQGYTASLILFNLYSKDLFESLNRMSLTIESSLIPGLLFADDEVVLTESHYN